MRRFVSKLIKKYAIAVCFVLALMYGMTGCAGTTPQSEAETDAPDVTMTALVAANERPTILARHKSMLLEYRNSGSDEVFREYIDGDYVYQMYADGDILIGKDEIWDVDEENGEKTFCYYWFAMDEKEEEETRITPMEYPSPVDNPYSIQETIESVQENADGTLTVRTWTNAEDTKEYMEAQQLEFPEGAEQRTEYVVERETLELISISAAVVADGEDWATSALNVTYDVDRPDELTALTTQIEELKSDPKTRTITVIYDYGTDAEQSYELRAAQSYRVAPFTRDGYDYLYRDPEKTEELEDADELGDVTVYAFTEE